MATWSSRLRTKLFGRYLIVTNTVGCGTLMGVGDIIVQLIDKRSNSEKLNAVGETISLSTRGEELDKRLIDWYRVGMLFRIVLYKGRLLPYISLYHVPSIFGWNTKCTLPHVPKCINFEILLTNSL